MKHDPYDDNQGHWNPNSVNASRAALGLPPLHRDVAEEDLPPWSAEEVTATLPAWLAFLFVAAAAVCFSIACGWLDWCYPR